MSPRLVNLAQGVWLFASAFLWHLSHAQGTNTWICGVLSAVFAIAGMGVPWARHLNTALALWLFISAWALPMDYIAALWNNLLCASAMFVVSLVPSNTGSLPGGLARLARLARRPGGPSPCRSAGAEARLPTRYA